MSSADVCHGSPVICQVNASVDDVYLTLSDLHPDQLYHISVTSTSAVNSQSDAVRLTLKTGPEGLTAGIVALMVIAGFLFLLLMAAAISCLVRSVNFSYSFVGVFLYFMYDFMLNEINKYLYSCYFSLCIARHHDFFVT